MALITMWMRNPPHAEGMPIMLPIIESIPIIPIMAPNTRPPASPPYTPCLMLVSVIVLASLIAGAIPTPKFRSAM